MKKSIYLFGASSLGKEAYNLLKDDFNIIGFLDNNSKRWGDEFLDGKKIISPSEITSISDDTIILITSSYFAQIALQLMNMKLEFYLFPCLEFCGLPVAVNKELCRSIDSAAKKLCINLTQVNISELPISDYNKKYLSSKNNNSIFTYSLILYQILSYNPNINHFLDYGGGTGLLSLLASEYGIRNVYYNDIYDVSCYDSEILANEMGYKRQGYICGDIDDVEQYTLDKRILFDGVGSYDVLEHIYNLEDFYLKLKSILHKGSIVCMESGANSFAPQDSLKLNHLKVEFFTRPKTYGHKERDSLKSYYEIRINIIMNFIARNNIELKEAEIVALAFLTRGKIVCDVEEAVNIYVEHNKLPTPDPFFCYNTCDPLTGNWAEHIIDFNSLMLYLSSIGYDCRLAFRGSPDISSTIQLLAFPQFENDN